MLAVDTLTSIPGYSGVMSPSSGWMFGINTIAAYVNVTERTIKNWWKSGDSPIQVSSYSLAGSWPIYAAPVAELVDYAFEKKDRALAARVENSPFKRSKD